MKKNNNDLIIKILNGSRNKLLLNFKFLTKALFELQFKVGDHGLGTDSVFFYYDEVELLKIYQYDKDSVIMVFIHSLVHCLLKHPISQGLEDPYYDLACDIITESIVEELLNAKSFHKKSLSKISKINTIKDNVENFIPKYVFKYLKENLSEGELREYQSIFVVDNHDYWLSKKDSQKEIKERNQINVKENEAKPNQDATPKVVSNPLENNVINYNNYLQEKWSDISQEVKMDMETFSQGIEAGTLAFNIDIIDRDKMSYTQFLREFSVSGEIMKENLDEFDIIYYSYGMSLYKNLALIEPLEYRDEKRIKEFVIAIDTSGSVYGPLVVSFLEKTYEVLTSENSFFKKVNIHIIQCDAQIQAVDIITSRRDIEEYIKNIKLRGFGGTDFRPVFYYIDEKVKNKEFRDLQGVIYFTDGYGTFPNYRPKYKSAFIFMESPYIPTVPPWAIKYVIDENEIKERKIL